MTPQQRHAVAYHEAGHAVAALRVGIRVHEVALTDVGGYVEHDRRHPAAERLIVTLGGPAVTGHLLGTCLDLDRHPFDKAAALGHLRRAHDVVLHDPFATPMFRWALIEAHALVNRAWPTIESVARALLAAGTLDRHDLLALVPPSRALRAA